MACLVYGWYMMWRKIQQGREVRNETVQGRRTALFEWSGRGRSPWEGEHYLKVWMWATLNSEVREAAWRKQESKNPALASFIQGRAKRPVQQGRRGGAGLEIRAEQEGWGKGFAVSSGSKTTGADSEWEGSWWRVWSRQGTGWDLYFNGSFWFLYWLTEQWITFGDRLTASSQRQFDWQNNLPLYFEFQKHTFWDFNETSFISTQAHFQHLLQHFLYPHCCRGKFTFGKLPGLDRR